MGQDSIKGAEHRAVQHYLLNLLPKGEAAIEVAFKELNRIADVVWEKKKLIFEIQCSKVSGEEVKLRNRDYQSAGYKVVWILHDRRFNRQKLSSAEIALIDSPHYFTNINRFSSGIIYDQFDLKRGPFRYFRMEPLEVDLSKPAILLGQISFAGDLASCTDQDYLERVKQKKMKSFSCNLRHLLKRLFLLKLGDQIRKVAQTK